MAVFPLSPAPSWYTDISPGAPHGVFYIGGTPPSVTLSKPGASTYTVRNYFGVVVSSGAATGLTLTPTPPIGGWQLGWYRLYLNGSNNDALFGNSYGSSNFVVIRPDDRFPVVPVGVGRGGEDKWISVKATLGMGTHRLSIGNTSAPETGSDTLTIAVADAIDSKAYWHVDSSSPYYDAFRPRLPWANFPNRTADYYSNGGLNIYCKNSNDDGSTIIITASTGTTSGIKLTINSETYDNLASPSAASTAINAASTIVQAFAQSGTALTTKTATAIGNDYRNGIIQVVQTLYPLGVTRYEGPRNEPNIASAETVHQMKLFQSAVHAGNVNAKAIGPCPVDIYTDKWISFFQLGGGEYCDEIAFHDYNSMTNGTLSVGQFQRQAFLDVLTRFNQQHKTLWQTEATHVFSSIYGVYHPRRSRVPLLQTLLWEQLGIPRERNSTWYDRSHGFWSYPAWWMNGDGTLNPYAVFYRVLAEETFGRPFANKLSFGTYGDKILLASQYTHTDSVIVLAATSWIDDLTVTFKVTGATTLTVVDSFGTTSTVSVENNLAIVAVTDTPVYVRLPVGVSVEPYTVNDWPPLSKQTTWQNTALGYSAIPSGSGTLNDGRINDGTWQTQYTGTTDTSKGVTLPDNATLTWSTATRFDRVLIWSGMSWQSESALIDFDLQTSIDGITWHTQKTITKPTPASFLHGTRSPGIGTQYETYWDEQWIFDIKLTEPTTAKAIRLHVRSTSYGGEPDLNAVNAGGQGNANQFITLQELVVLCDDNVLNPSYGAKVTL